MKLSKDQQSRLDDLNKEWENGESKAIWSKSEKITVSDLKLLLEHHSGVQALIRRLVDETSADAAPVYTYNNANTDKELSALRAELAQEKATNQRLQNENSALQTLIRQSRTDLEREQAKTAQVRDSQSRLDQCEAQLKDAQTALERARNANQPPQVVRWLRQETDLAKRMGIADLPADTLQALTAVVAVFSQSDNLERLWDTLRERSESQSRCASAEELALLDSSIAWTNINRPSNPIEVLAVQGYDFDFDQQTRSRTTPTGERIGRTVLPGLAESRGKVIKKPIVTTC